MRSCPNCGAQVPDQDVFCSECGARPRRTGRAGGGRCRRDRCRPWEGGSGRSQIPSPLGRHRRLAVLVVLLACGVSAFILVNRSASTGEPVFLGASSTPPATRPRRVSTPIVPPIFEETFDDDAGEWSVWEDEHGTKGVEDGVYYITVSDTGWASWGTSDRTFDDLVVQVEAWAADGPDDNGYGLVFRYQDSDNFYYYDVDKSKRGSIASRQALCYNGASPSERERPMRS